MSIKGGSKIVLSVMAGELEAGALYPAEIKGGVDSGHLKVLAVGGDTRWETFPDAPYVADVGSGRYTVDWRM